MSQVAMSQAASEQNAAAQRDMQDGMMPKLSVQQLVERLDAVPTFAIMSENRESGKKRFVPMRFFEDDASRDEAALAPLVCAFFLDPREAKRSLAQAQAAVGGDMALVLGAMPLGHAFSLCVAREYWQELHKHRNGCVDDHALNWVSPECALFVIEWGECRV